MEAGRLFPAAEQPLSECVLCRLARRTYDGKLFYCGLTERIEGAFINRQSLTEREVKLARGVTVDGNSIPSGTVLKLVAGKASDRVWCRRPKYSAPFLVDKTSLDFGNDVVEVDFTGVIQYVFLHAVQIGGLLFPRPLSSTHHVLDLMVDGEWIDEEVAASYIGSEVTRLRLPLWLAREKGLEADRR
jgi:hypothetical protein